MTLVEVRNALGDEQADPGMLAAGTGRRLNRKTRTIVRHGDR
jgi:hypothetical protein